MKPDSDTVPSMPAEDDKDLIDVDPALSRQIDENLQLLYRSKLLTALPPALQARVEKPMRGQGQT